jgi:hypothetical protein
MSIYLFEKNLLLHDGGHSVIALALSLCLWLIPQISLPAWLAFTLGCTVTALILESIDRFLGGFVVTIEQRIKILQSYIRRRDEKGIPVWVPSPDNCKDFLNYQNPWPFYFLFKFSLFPWAQIVGIVLIAALFVTQYNFYKGIWSW